MLCFGTGLCCLAHIIQADWHPWEVFWDVPKSPLNDGMQTLF